LVLAAGWDEMDANTLELPIGALHAQYVDGMREIAVYNIAWDGFMGRWDTLINSRQSYVIGHSLPEEKLDAFLGRFRPIALAAFKAQEQA
jgi:hypothetical protein